MDRTLRRSTPGGLFSLAFVANLLLWLLACGALLSGSPGSAWAKGGSDKRVALVIGNADYKNAPLANPVHDAKDMAAALRSVGFDVIEKVDASQKEMNRAIARFGEKLTRDSVAIFYYAGHGLQVRGKNYLIPVDAEITGENSIRAETVDVDAVLDQLGASDLSVVILDACRNNPFERRFRSLAGGLAQMDAPKGTLIAYSTAPGKTAFDGEGRNGLYTLELLKEIRKIGLTVETVFKNVRRSVARTTSDQQIPWESSSLTGDFYFNPVVASMPPSPTAAAPAPVPQAAASGVRTMDPDAATGVAPSTRLSQEDELWKAAAATASTMGYEAYLAEYPAGRYASAARLRLASLRPTTDRVPAPPAPARSESMNDTGQGGTRTKPPPPSEIATSAGTGEPPGKPAGTPAIETPTAVITKDMKATGEFRSEPGSDAISGTGHVTWTNGDSYDGSLVQGVKQGKGRFVWKNGQTFDGDWDRGNPNGKGTYVYVGGDRYTGSVKDGKRHGQGTYVDKQRNTYDGGWNEDMKHGHGRWTWANGGFWEGEFKDDKQILTGRMVVNASDTTMTGDFTLNPTTGAVTGTGQVVWTNGDRYEGALINGIKQGNGKFIWKNGQQYAGDWDRGAPNGKGRINYENGDQYEGDVIDGEPDGQGTYRLTNGDVYVGAWVKGKKHGHGRLTWVTGSFWEGEFKENQQTDSGYMASAESVPVVPAGATPSQPKEDETRGRRLARKTQ